MKLAWATDPHLNFVGREGAEAFAARLAASGAERLVISGDIAESDDFAQYLGLLADRFPGPIDFVLGNHDFYRGSIAAVREMARALTRGVPSLNWLPEAGIISLTSEIALIGHDGWGDARLGDFRGSTIRLNDYKLIAELSGLDTIALEARLQALGAEAAEHLRRALPRALERHGSAILVTHVPPFREACWHQGRLSDDNWLPHFSCGAVGEAIRAIMSARPDRRLLVLCGHVHSSGSARPLPNVAVETAGAVYGRPEVARVWSLPRDLETFFG